MAKKNFLKFSDTVTFDVKSVKTIKDFLYQQPNQSAANINQHGFVVKMAATHSGKIINNRMYLPDQMSAGVRTFVKPYPKAVHLNHDTYGDPLGRIISSQYVDTSHSIKSLLSNSSSIKNSGIITLSPEVIDEFVSGGMSLVDEWELIRAFSINKILDNEEYSGLGFAEIDLHITNEDAIQKFLDGRYLTGSVGATTDQAICSICKQDWIKNDQCEHQPGENYDGLPAFIICGKLTYREYSIVGDPADEGSIVMQMTLNGQEKTLPFTNKKSYQVGVILMDSKENKMPEQPMDQTATTAAATIPTTDTVTPPAPPAATPVPEISKEDQILVKIFEGGEITADEEEMLYAYMMKDCDGEEKVEIAEDKKLSAESRKKMASSSFCGPNRSFPVPDCAHYTAAKRLIGRYKGTGDKTAILACVERKGKALGCTSKKEDAFDPSKVLPVDLTKDQLVALSEHLKTLVPDCSCSAPADLANDNKALLGEVARLEDELGKNKENFAVLQVKYDAVFKDFQGIQTQAIQDKLAVKNAKAECLRVLKSLADKKVCLEKDISEMTNEVIDSEIGNCVKVLDIQKICDKLNDGMSRNPDGNQVANPCTTGVGPVVKDKEPDMLTKDELEKLEALCLQYQFSHGVEAASKWMKAQLDSLTREGRLPQNKV